MAWVPLSIDETQPIRPLFEDRKPTKEVLFWFDNNSFLHHSIKGERVRKPQADRMYRDFEEFLSQLGKVFGYDLQYAFPSRYDHVKGSLVVLFPRHKESLYVDDHDSGVICHVRTREVLYSSKNGGTTRTELEFTVFLASSIWSTIQKHLRKYDPNAGQYSGDAGIRVRRGELVNYKRQLNTLGKKHSVPIPLLPTYASALEIYSRYARRNDLPLNRTGHIATGIKSGMMKEGAVWLAVNNVPGPQAAEFSEIPLSWLNDIVGDSDSV